MSATYVVEIICTNCGKVMRISNPIMQITITQARQKIRTRGWTTKKNFGTSEIFDYCPGCSNQKENEVKP